MIDRLIRESSLDSRDRVAGLLVLIYGQPIARIARLRLDDVQAAERGVLLRLGKEPIAMVEPVACLLSALVREPHGGAVTAATRTPWLFPGKVVDQHLDNERLRRRLKDLGIPSRASRASALLPLAREVPAPVLAEMLGLSDENATGWAKAAGSDYARYAASRADLLDYLQCDHRFTGLPMSLGQRFMSSFYVIPGDVGGIYKRRMALLIHRKGRPRQDVVTEIIKHLRYRYELQERVLVHHLKLTADAMIGKMFELWHEAERAAIEELDPDAHAAALAGVPPDFEIAPHEPDSDSAGQRSETHRLRTVGSAETAEDHCRQVQKDQAKMSKSSEIIARWRLEQLLLDRGDDGVLEHLRVGTGRQSAEADASRELATRLLDRVLYQHAANATGAFAAKDLHKASAAPLEQRHVPHRRRVIDRA